MFALSLSIIGLFAGMFMLYLQFYTHKGEPVKSSLRSVSYNNVIFCCHLYLRNRTCWIYILITCWMELAELLNADYKPYTFTFVLEHDSLQVLDTHFCGDLPRLALASYWLNRRKANCYNRIIWRLSWRFCKFCFFVSFFTSKNQMKVTSSNGRVCFELAWWYKYTEKIGGIDFTRVNSLFFYFNSTSRQLVFTLKSRVGG